MQKIILKIPVTTQVASVSRTQIIQYFDCRIIHNSFERKQKAEQAYT